MKTVIKFSIALAIVVIYISCNNSHFGMIRKSSALSAGENMMLNDARKLINENENDIIRLVDSAIVSGEISEPKLDLALIKKIASSFDTAYKNNNSISEICVGYKQDCIFDWGGAATDRNRHPRMSPLYDNVYEYTYNENLSFDRTTFTYEHGRDRDAISIPLLKDNKYKCTLVFTNYGHKASQSK